jgi:hypothetical protein
MIDLVSPRTISLVSSSDEYGEWLRAGLEQRGLAVSSAPAIGQAGGGAIALFLDHVAQDQGRQLMQDIRAAAGPLAVLLAGEAASDVCRAALGQAGAIVAPDTDAFLDALTAMAAGASPAGRRVRVAGIGAAAALAESACRQAGLEVVETGEDGVIATGAELAETDVPAIVCGPGAAIPTPERAARAYAALARWAERTARQDTAPNSPDVTPMKFEGTGVMDEYETKRLLDRWNVPVVPETLITGPGRHEFTPIRKLATHFGFPVVLKAIREDIVHKAELGAVAAGIATVDQLKAAWEDMHGRFPDAAWLIQPFLPGDVEVLIAARRDPVFGPVVMFGPGGIMSELYHDVALRAAPLTQADALEMIEETKAAELLSGFHGLPVHDLGEVAEVIVKVGDLMAGQPTVDQIDLNPLLVTEMGSFVVDAKALIV